jgi:hypothetical protein
VALAAALPFSRTLITNDERLSLVEFGRDYLAKLTAYWSRGAEQTEPSHAI